MSDPARTASSRPLPESATSTQPVNRFLAFQSLSPWRTRSSRYDVSIMRSTLGHVQAAYDERPRRESTAGASREGWSSDGSRVLARDQEDDPAGHGDRVVADPLVVAAEQGHVDGGLDTFAPVV